MRGNELVTEKGTKAIPGQTRMQQRTAGIKNDKFFFPTKALAKRAKQKTREN